MSKKPKSSPWDGWDYMLSIVGDSVTIDIRWPIVDVSQTSVTLNTPAGALTFSKGNWPGGSSAVLIDLEEVDEFIEHISTFFTDTPEPVIRQLHSAVALIRREDAKKEAIDRPFNPLAAYNPNPRHASAKPQAMTKASPFVLFDRPTTLTPEMLNAYLETDYQVVTPPGDNHERTFTMRVGQVCEQLAMLYQDRGIQCAAFVTAYNPYSAAHEDLDNETRQASLLQTLDQHKVIYLSGEGRHPSGNWPAEPSVLALNLPLDACKRLGMRFHQNAVLWCGTDAIPHLVLLM
jgi:hypothetical protein